MKRVSFQGKGLSAGQRRQLELQRLSRPGAQYAVADFVSLREKIESRMFVGPQSLFTAIKLATRRRGHLTGAWLSNTLAIPSLKLMILELSPSLNGWAFNA